MPVLRKICVIVQGVRFSLQNQNKNQSAKKGKLSKMSKIMNWNKIVHRYSGFAGFLDFQPEIDKEQIESI